MNNKEQLVVHLTKSEKEYIIEKAKKSCLSIDQFLVLCALSIENMMNTRVLDE